MASFFILIGRNFSADKNFGIRWVCCLLVVATCLIRCSASEPPVEYSTTLEGSHLPLGVSCSVAKIGFGRRSLYTRNTKGLLLTLDAQFLSRYQSFYQSPDVPLLQSNDPDFNVVLRASHSIRSTANGFQSSTITVNPLGSVIEVEQWYSVVLSPTKALGYIKRNVMFSLVAQNNHHRKVLTTIVIPMSAEVYHEVVPSVPEVIFKHVPLGKGALQSVILSGLLPESLSNLQVSCSNSLLSVHRLLPSTMEDLDAAPRRLTSSYNTSSVEDNKSVIFGQQKTFPSTLYLKVLLSPKTPAGHLIASINIKTPNGEMLSIPVSVEVVPVK